MSCFHPLKAIQYKKLPGLNPGKHPIRILHKEEYEREWNDEVEVLKIPCGQCAGCRMDYAHQWANRLMLELESYKNDLESCHFITLTIDDDSISDTGFEEETRYGRIPNLHVRRPYADASTGLLLGWSHSLCKYDLQLFLKRLRKQHPNDRIRFFACGEYGSKTYRPHYHLIVFGLHFDDGDLSFYKKSKLGYDYKNSESLSKIWPYGYNVVAPVTWESCCYVARYMMKKLKGEGREIYDKFNLEEPFTQMSRRPGIAHEYYEDHPLAPDTVYIVTGSGDGNRKFPPPRYLEKLFELDDPEAAENRRKIRRLSAVNRQNLVLRRTDLSGEEYLAMKEKQFMKNVRLLDDFRFL